MVDVEAQSTLWGAPARTSAPKRNAAQAPASKPGASKPVATKPVAKKPRLAKASAVVKPEEEVTAGSGAASRATVDRNKRDPFASVIQSSTQGPACAAGKKCLVPNQVVLRGVVKGPDGMLAVVENQQRRAYFLHENDPVFNGQVVRITADSIVFREKVLDKLGHEQTREVVKRIAVAKPV
jgi:hypothetical protein